MDFIELDVVSVAFEPTLYEITDDWRNTDNSMKLYQQKIELILPDNLVEKYISEVFENSINKQSIQQTEIWEQKTLMLVMWFWRTDLSIRNAQQMVQKLLYHLVRIVLVSDPLSVDELRELYFKILKYLPEYLRKLFKQGWLQEGVLQLQLIFDKYGDDIEGDKFVSIKNMFALMALDFHVSVDELITLALEQLRNGNLSTAKILTEIIRSGPYSQFYNKHCSQQIAKEFQEALFEGHKLISPQMVQVQIGDRQYEVKSSFLNYQYKQKQDSFIIEKFRSKCSILDCYNNNLLVCGSSSSNRRSKLKVVDPIEQLQETVATLDQEIFNLDSNGEQICAFGQTKVWVYCGGAGEYQQIQSTEIQGKDGIGITNLCCGRVLQQKCFFAAWCKKGGQECSRILIQDLASLGVDHQMDIFGDRVNDQQMILSLAMSNSCVNSLYVGAARGILQMWDLRDHENVSLRFGSKKGAHKKGVSTIDCWDNILVSGSNDRSVHVWDIRQPYAPVAAKEFDHTPIVSIKLVANYLQSSLNGIVGVCTTNNVYCASLEQDSVFKDDRQIQVLPLEEVEDLVDFCWCGSNALTGLHVVGKHSGVYSFDMEFWI